VPDGGIVTIIRLKGVKQTFTGVGHLSPLEAPSELAAAITSTNASVSERDSRIDDHVPTRQSSFRRHRR
jgi:hypothetical protein